MDETNKDQNSLDAEKQVGDMFIVGFIRNAEHANYSWNTPVTVNVQGVLMSGQIISYKNWFKLMMEGLKSAVLIDADGNAISAEVQEGWTAAHETLQREGEESIKQANTINYLHLRNVSILNAPEPMTAPYCRIRLQDISALILGAPSV